MNNFTKGSEWRKWDLHVHTKYTNKSDCFTSHDFNSFCVTLFKEALRKNIKAIGITDYFMIDNYKKVKKFVDNISLSNDFNEQDIDNIKNIFLLPNIELRMMPVTGSGSLVNIHCIFNPNTDFMAYLENNFFGALEDSGGNKMNKNGFIALGKSSDSILDDTNACKKGVDEFILEPSQLINLFKKNPKLKENTIIAVSNSSTDGASALQEHYKLFENEAGSLDEVRSNIYKLSNAIFSGNPQDKNFFLGKKDGSDKQQVINKCGSLKPCIHGSDAHCEKQLFSPDKNRFCWIKSDLTFEGLKQIIYEPENRVFIGEEPPILSRVENNKTKYIDCLKIDQADEYSGDTWFKDIQISFNKELVAIIGNKGSGKSGIADILGLVGDSHTGKEYFSFLNKKKFCKGKLADKFKAEIIWESKGKSGEIALGVDIKTEKPESVRFIPQNYFEELTNELEISKFQTTLENIIFGYIPDAEKLTKSSFSELVEHKTSIINTSIEIEKNKIKEINSEIIALENKINPSYIEKIDGLITEKNIEIKAQKTLLSELPKIDKPNKDNEIIKQQYKQIEEKQKNLSTLEIELQKQKNEKLKLFSKKTTLEQIKEQIQQQEKVFSEFISDNQDKVQEYGLDINNIFKIELDYSSIDNLIDITQAELDEITPLLKSVDEIKQGNSESSNLSIYWKIKVINDDLQKEKTKLSAEQQTFQKNEQRKKDIGIQIKELTGNTENPEPKTLKFYEEEKAFIKNELPTALTNKRSSRLKLSANIFSKKEDILNLYNSFKQAVDNKISQNQKLLEGYDIKINSSFNLKPSFYDDFLSYINQNKKGTFYGTEEGLRKIKEILEVDIYNQSSIESMLTNIIDSLESDTREPNEKNRIISEQVKELDRFYEFLFSLDYLQPKYELTLGVKTLDKLSPGERGALLLIFYLMIDKEDIPLIIDQPEDNLDNESVYNMLSKFIKKAKAGRQIIMVTHNPNLAVGADAEQIIHVNIDKQKGNKFSFTSGSIENIKINKKIVRILEGTKPAFDKRKLKYQNNNL